MISSPLTQRTVTAQTNAAPAKMAGFTLIEILIAVVIFSIGLLGLAGMQLRSSGDTNTAYFRSQATLIANDMAERLHANRGGAYDDAAYLNMDSTGVCAGATPSPFCETRESTQGAECNPKQMADFDLYTLACSIDGTDSTKALLPSAKLTVTCSDNADLVAGGDGNDCTAGSSHTITVSWSEIRDGKAQADGKASRSEVTLVVLP